MQYHSSKEWDCIFEIHQLWQSGFSGVYSNCCCSCSFEPENIKIGQSSHKMYRNNILNFQESTIILNAHMKKVWKLIICTSYLLISWDLTQRNIKISDIWLSIIQISIGQLTYLENYMKVSINKILLTNMEYEQLTTYFSRVPVYLSFLFITMACVYW